VNLRSGLVIGRVRGIDIRVHWSWLAIFALLTWMLSQELFRDAFPRWPATGQWAAGVTTALLFFLSVLIHELSHALTALRYGMRVPSITLFIFGGVSNLEGEMHSAGQEFRVAIAGPLMSWLLALLFAVAWFALRTVDVSLILGYMAVINLVLGLFNLLPGFPLDGGRVLRSALWARSGDLLRATRTATRIGTAIAYAMVLLGIVNIVAFGMFGGLWYILVGVFVRSAVRDSYAAVLLEHTLRGARTGDAMGRSPAPVHAALSLQRLVDEYWAVSEQRAFLVEQEGAIVGIVTAEDVAAVPRSIWSTTPVGSSMTRSSELLTVSPRTPLLQAIRMMEERRLGQLPVLAEGRLAGLLTREDTQRYLARRAADGADRAPDAD
jgi:Zn-dependent protease